MSNSEVTKAPAMTPAQRQANRQARVRDDVQRGREARHQVNSLNTLLTHMAARDLRLEIDPATLPLEQPINAMMEILMRQVREAEAARHQIALQTHDGSDANVTHVLGESGDMVPATKPAKERQIAATVRPSKGDAKPTKSRKRVAK